MIVPSGKLRILQLAAPSAVGGLERVVQALAIGHHERGHDVCVVAIVDMGAAQDHPFLAPLHDHGVPVRVVEVRPRHYLAERRAVSAVLDDFQPDVLHSHGYRPDVLDAGLAKRRRIPIVTTLHGSSRMGGLSTLHELVQLAVLRRFDAVVAVSKPLQRELSGPWASRDRVHFIPNAWTGRPPALDRAAARRRLRVPADETVVAWVGRLIPIKAAEIFLHAIALSPRAAWKASIVGDGPRRVALERLANRLGISDRVRFHGNVFDIAQSFRAFDAFVLSSRSEGTPVVLFEAMAAGVPIIATDVGGVRDVLGDDGGVLVPSQDPNAMAAAIAATLTDTGAAADRTASASRRLLERYAVGPWLEAHETLYRSLRARNTAHSRSHDQRAAP